LSRPWKTVREDLEDGSLEVLLDGTSYCCY